VFASAACQEPCLGQGAWGDPALRLGSVLLLPEHGRASPSGHLRWFSTKGFASNQDWVEGQNEEWECLEQPPGEERGLLGTFMKLLEGSLFLSSAGYLFRS
jgi:hypothetical protein